MTPPTHMEASTIGYRAGDSTVEVRTGSAALTQFMDSFLDRESPGSSGLLGSIIIDAEGLPGDTLHAGDQPHVDFAGTRCSRTGDSIVLRPNGQAEADYPGALRSLTRELWIAAHAVDSWYLHASAVTDGRHLVAFAGDKRHGKSTLMLDAVLTHGWRLVTNDGLLLLLREGRLLAAPVPTLVKLRADTALRRLNEIAAACKSDAFNTAQLTRWLATKPMSRIGLDPDELFLTFRSLGEPFGCHNLDDVQLVVAEVGFSEDGQTRLHEVHQSDRQNELREALDRHHKQLPLRYSALHGCRTLADSVPTRDEAAARAAYLRFAHAGEAAPLLRRLPQVGEAVPLVKRIASVPRRNGFS